MLGDSVILLKHNKNKNSTIARIIDDIIPEIRSFDFNNVHDNTEQHIAEIPDASIAKANKYSVGIAIFIIINDENVNTIKNDKIPQNRAMTIFFKILLSFVILFVVISEFVIKKSLHIC